MKKGMLILIVVCCTILMFTLTTYAGSSMEDTLQPNVHSSDIKADYYDEMEFVGSYNNLFIDAVNNNEFDLIQDMLDKTKSVYSKEKAAINDYVSKGIKLKLVECSAYNNKEISNIKVNVYESIKFEITQKNKNKFTQNIIKVFTVLNNGQNLKIVNIQTLNETTANLNALRKGLQKIKSQSFSIDLNNWGSVCFNSYQQTVNKFSKLSFCLCDDTDNVLYQFPQFYGNKQPNFKKIDAISFKDINNDGFKDIIIIAQYDTGSKSAKLSPVASIYFQKDNKFKNIPGLDNQINNTRHNKTISTVLNFIKGKNMKIS